MTLVMDGVRRTSGGVRGAAMVMPVPTALPSLPSVPVSLPKREPRPAMKPISRATSRANRGVRYVTGMDGIRRAVQLTPREMLANMSAPEVPAAVAAVPAGAWNETEVSDWAEGAPEWAAPSPWRMPSLRLPAVEWKRPAIAFGLVATALVASGLTVRALVTPRMVTARAESSAPATKAPVPTVKAAAVAPAPQKTGLQQLLNDFVAANGGTFGIVVQDLKTGETASVNPDAQITSASLYKLFVAQRVYQRIDVGQLDYSSPAGGDTGRNVDQCLTIMINISDNDCGRALGSILGWGSQDQALQLEGYKQTTLQSPQQTSAADVAKLFSRLYNGTLVSSNSGQRFLGLLKDQRVNNRLPVGLPAGTVIAHKTGDLDGVVHDAGIVYGPKTDYLVVVTSGPWAAPAGAPAKFANLSSQLWNYFEQ